MYYPLEKITPNLHTNGNEYYIASTQKNYTGDYYSTYDGRFFTGKLPTPQAQELLKYNASSNTTTTLESYTYNNLLSNMVPHDAPVHYLSVPTEEDYTKGYYQRYFSKRVNGDESTITEITKDAYEDLVDNPLYVRTSITWHISGATEDRVTGGVPIYGVLNRNILSIRGAKSEMSGLNYYLKNPLEHYRK